MSGGAYFLSQTNLVVLILESGAYFRVGLFSRFYGIAKFDNPGLKSFDTLLELLLYQ